MKTKLLFLFAFVVMCCTTAMAQSRVKGSVVSANENEPLIGVAVQERGTTNGVITDADGNFQINLTTANATLVVSYVGYTTQYVSVNGRSQVNIRLEEDSKLLDDVVVVGYGTMKKSDLAGSVTSVNTQEMMRRTPVNIAQGLQGAAAGVMVTQQDGAPDANAQIRIRGVGTINGSAAPLYVVDGIQVGSDANFINPADIESIEILKDASATAIYGSQGANGVIMITTKHGTKGKLTVNFTADFGIQTLPYTLETLDIDAYAKMVRETRKNEGAVITNLIWGAQYDGQRSYIDWQKEMTRNALRQQYGLSASGGAEKSTYNFSVGYLDNDGLVIASNMKRLTLRANMTASPTKYLTLGGDVNYVRTESNGSNIGMANNGNLSSLRDYAFWTPTLDYVDNGQIVSPNLVNPDGTYGIGQLDDTGDAWEGNKGGLMNPYASQMEAAHSRIVRSNRVNASAYLELTLMKGLTLKSVGSYSLYAGEDNTFSGGNKRYNYINGVLTEMTRFPQVQNQDYSFSLSNNSSYNLGIETYLTYNWKNEYNNLTIMGGNTVGKSYGQWVSGSASGFLYEWNRNLSLTPDQDRIGKASGGFNTESHNISYFGRLAYTLMDRYILTATIRRDGSSNFGAGNRWGTFPSFALGWRFTEEDFMKNQEILSNGKLRLGWGQTGNAGMRSGAAIAALTASDRFNYYPGQGGSLGSGGATSTAAQEAGLFMDLVDTNLKWETNEQLNIGIDLGLLDGDLNIVFDWFKRDSKDLLLDYQMRASSGFTELYTNYGSIRNTGLEMSFSYNKQLNNDWNIHATLNASTLKNKVTKMGDPLYKANTEGGNGMWNTIDGSNIGGVGDPAGYHWGGHSISMEGYAVGSFYGFRTDGIIQDEADLAAYKETFSKGFDGTPGVGDFKFKDLNGDKILDENDREVLGNGFPKFNYGLNLGANYKNWDFSASFNGVLGQKIFSYSAMRLSTVFMSDEQTFPNMLKDSWKQVAHVENGRVTNPNATLPRVMAVDTNYNMRASDAWIKNGNFVRLSNLQIGYTLPRDIAQKLQLQSLRVYGSISNVFVFSPYKKYGDPEIGQGSVLYTGFDTGRYPMPRTYQLGLSVSF